MHPDELTVDVDTVRRLIAAQFPRWSDEPVHRVTGDGTVNAIFRIGDGFAARFRLTSASVDEVTEELAREAAAMSELAATIPFPTPTPLGVGTPGEGYPLPWSIQTWIPGDVATSQGLSHSTTFASDIIALLRDLRAVDPHGRSFDGSGRGGELPDSDGWMEVCFRESAGLLPVDELRALWSRFRTLPRTGPDRMTHGDLTPANLLVSGERLVGVLDGGGFAAADPALDLVSVWHLFDAPARDTVRRGLDIGANEWQRGAGWAFQQAMGLVWYYRESNPGMSALGRITLTRLLADPGLQASSSTSRSLDANASG